MVQDLQSGWPLSMWCGPWAPASGNQPTSTSWSPGWDTLRISTVSHCTSVTHRSLSGHNAASVRLMSFSQWAWLTQSLRWARCAAVHFECLCGKCLTVPGFGWGRIGCIGCLLMFELHSPIWGGCWCLDLTKTFDLSERKIFSLETCYIDQPYILEWKPRHYIQHLTSGNDQSTTCIVITDREACWKNGCEDPEGAHLAAPGGRATPIRHCSVAQHAVMVPVSPSHPCPQEGLP